MLGLKLVFQDHVTRLKWHRLRRSMNDPEFGTAVMLDGFHAGASMELDLRVRGDGGFVVLHDVTLERETTGTGLAAVLTGPQIAALRYRTQDRAPILSEDLAQMLDASHPEALLQLDMKDDFHTVGQRGVDHFAELFADRCQSIIISGGSIPLIRGLALRLPDLKRGYDPTDALLALWASEGLVSVERHLATVLHDQVKPNMLYLQWQMLLAAQAQGLDMVAMAHDEGVLVDAWTHKFASPKSGFSDAEWHEFAALLTLRPDQITTDEPVATEAAYQARCGQPSA